MKFLNKKKIPSLGQWRSLYKVFTKKEKIGFSLVLAIFIISLVTFSVSTYFSKTKEVPAFGGTYIEGLIGYPRFINPIYSLSDVDRNITSLLFSGLLYYDHSKGFVMNMAETIIKEESSYRMKLRDDLKWSNGKAITAQDIIFTINTIQDPAFKSPLRADWIGIKVEKVSDLEIIFHLEAPSTTFFNNLSLKIIPYHIWGNVPSQNFPLSEYNLSPVGSGPYRIKAIEKDNHNNVEKITLEINPYYHGKVPYIEKISFTFFSNKSEIIYAANSGEILGFSIIDPRDYENIVEKTGFHIQQFQMPRYFALFFNLERDDVLNKNIRKALRFGTNKKEIIGVVLNGKGEVVNSPIIDRLDYIESPIFDIEKAKEILDSIGFKERESGFRYKTTIKNIIEFTDDLEVGSRGENVRNLQRCLLFLSENDEMIFPDGTVSGFFGQKTREAIVTLQEKYKEEILDPWGFTKGTGMVGKSTRKKLNSLCGEAPGETSKLELSITTVDQELMVRTAEMIQRQWEKIGVKVNIVTHNPNALEREIIRPRNYDILLFGKAFNAIPDLFPFWHSSQKSEFGLNLSMYSSLEVDSLLETIRVEKNEEKRDNMIDKLELLILEDIPAIFLFNSHYLFFTSSKVYGIEPNTIINPSERFLNIENWYIKTKRIRKNNESY